MGDKSHITIKQYHCAQCGALNDADLWNAGILCEEISVYYDYCYECPAITGWAIADGIILPLGTQEAGVFIFRDQMLAAGQLQLLSEPLGAGWDIERDAPKRRQAPDDIPF